MSDLSGVERRILEKVFRMSDGYIMGFNNSTFGEFVLDTIAVDVYAKGMDALGTSKANRMRHLFNILPNHRLGVLLKEMLAVEELEGATWSPVEEATRLKARQIAGRLAKGGSVEGAEALLPNSSERNFEALAREVREAIDRDQPEVGLDRLHTFAVKYIRTLYEQHFNRPANRDATANSLLGEYANELKKNGHIDSKMTAEILKSSARVLDAFNHVRNNQTLAHDNPELVNRDEARFIFSTVAISIRFLKGLHERIEATKQSSHTDFDDIPF
jgi:hypothetical protein